MTISKDDVFEELAKTDKRLDEVLTRLNDLEELDLIQEYISLLDETEYLHRKRIKQSIRIKEKEMLECKHLLVIGNKCEEDRLLDGEAVVCCLKCGLTNGINYLRKDYPSIERMKEITHMTIHNGRFIYDGVVSDMQLVQRRYNELKGKMSDDEISKVINEEIRCKKNTSIKRF